MPRSIMKRWHEEYPRTFREWRKHYLFHVESNINWNRALGADPYEVDCVCDRQKGLFRKRRALSCGRARCQLCHGHKYPKRQTTHGEVLSEVKLKEGIDELTLPKVENDARALYGLELLSTVFGTDRCDGSSGILPSCECRPLRRRPGRLVRRRT
jgi:hypothetical protein